MQVQRLISLAVLVIVVSIATSAYYTFGGDYSDSDVLGVCVCVRARVCAFACLSFEALPSLHLRACVHVAPCMPTFASGHLISPRLVLMRAYLSDYPTGFQYPTNSHFPTMLYVAHP